LLTRQQKATAPNRAETSSTEEGKPMDRTEAGQAIKLSPETLGAQAEDSNPTKKSLSNRHIDHSSQDKAHTAKNASEKLECEK
jgi:hypothetical protein